MPTPGPCLMWHASVHSGPHSFGPSDSCPLLTGQTACGAELKHYILEITLLNPYSRRHQLSYTPSVTNLLLISHESYTSRQKHQTLADPHFNRHTRHTDGAFSCPGAPHLIDRPFVQLRQVLEWLLLPCMPPRGSSRPAAGGSCPIPRPLFV